MSKRTPTDPCKRSEIRISSCPKSATSVTFGLGSRKLDSTSV